MLSLARLVWDVNLHFRLLSARQQSHKVSCVISLIPDLPIETFLRHHHGLCFPYCLFSRIIRAGHLNLDHGAPRPLPVVSRFFPDFIRYPGGFWFQSSTFFPIVRLHSMTSCGVSGWAEQFQKRQEYVQRCSIDQNRSIRALEFKAFAKTTTFSCFKQMKLRADASNFDPDNMTLLAPESFRHD